MNSDLCFTLSSAALKSAKPELYSFRLSIIQDFDNLLSFFDGYMATCLPGYHHGPEATQRAEAEETKMTSQRQ